MQTLPSSPPAAAERPARELALSERLRAHVVNYAGAGTLACVFVPGGKLNGVGIPSDLWCRTCHRGRIWHDVAAAAAIAAASEDASRLPFDHPLPDVAPAAAIAEASPAARSCEP